MTRGGYAAHGGQGTDTLVIESIAPFMYRVRYNGFVCIVPWFRVDSAIVRVVRRYHATYGGGR